MPKAQAATIRSTVNAAAKAGALGATSAAAGTAGGGAAGGLLSSLGAKILVGVVVAALALGMVAVVGMAGVVGIGAVVANILVAPAQKQEKPALQMASGLNPVAVSSRFMIIIQEDGTVATTLQESTLYEDEQEMRKDVLSWTDLISVDASFFREYNMDIDKVHVVGLRSDGTVVATGDNSHGECEVQEWTDITAVFAGTDYTVGLQKDGTLVYTDAAYWVEDYLKTNDPGNIATVCGGVKVVGVLHKDGTVWFSDQAMNEAFLVTNAVQLCVSGNSAFVLKTDGTVQNYGCGRGEGYCKCKYWTDVVQIASSSQVHLGLKADGTVCACGIGYEGEFYDSYWIEEWTDIAYIWVHSLEPYGVKKDGTIIWRYGSDGWTNIRVFDPNSRG